MQRTEVARFERAGDVRTMSIVRDKPGCLEVHEDLMGPSAYFAYGDDLKTLCVTLSDEALSGIQRVIVAGGGTSLSGYLANEENDIVDLMDLCDAHEIPYAFASMGSESGIYMRPASQS